MDHANLGENGPMISRIGFGCEQLGGNDWGETDRAEITRAVRVALENGVNLFDTADVYGLGRSESLLSNALGQDRSRVVVATKFGVAWKLQAGQRAKTFIDCSPAHAVRALDASLRRLRLDCIPLYQMHWPDAKVPVEDTLLALEDCRRQGKLAHIGLANCSRDLLSRAREICDITSVQLSYSVLNRGAEKDLLPYCRQTGVGVLAYGTLAHGLLTGKYDASTQFPPTDRRHRLEMFRGEVLERNLVLVRRVVDAAQSSSKSPSQLALRWVLDNPDISSALVGIKSVDQLEANLGALGWRLPDHWQREIGSPPVGD